MNKLSSDGTQSSRSLLSQNWRFHAKELLGKKKPIPLRKTPELAGKRFILYPDDPWMQAWGAIITLLMCYTATVTPYRVALVDVDSSSWVAVDIVIDCLFGVDVLVNCCLSYYNEDSILVTSYKVIVLRYMRTWMLPDILACLPFQTILQANSSYNNMIKLVRLPRVYKLIKLAKLFRIMKIIKNRSRIMVYVNSILRVGLSFERLVWFVLWLMLILHLFACTWIFFGKLNELDFNNWIHYEKYDDYDSPSLYLVSMYFSITTLATVGYGDITPCNNTERVVCSLMMLVGIFGYSIVIGSLTNILSNLDRRKAALNGKLNLLSELSSKYNLNKLFHHKLTQALEYEHRNSTKELEDLVNGLPSTLRTQLLIAIYCKMIENNAFFEGKTDHFVAWVSPQLSPCKIVEDEYVYKEGDPIVEMYFVIRGEVQYVLGHVSDEPGFHVVKSNYYFGEEDLLFSETRMHKYTVKTVLNTEFLTLSKEHFEELLSTFESEAIEILEMTEQRRIRILAHKADAEAAVNTRAQVQRHESGPKRPALIPMHNIIQEEKDGDMSNTEETPQRHGRMKRYGSIDLLQRSDSMTPIERKKTLVRQYTMRQQNSVRDKEIREMKTRMERMEEVLCQVEGKMREVIAGLGAAVPVSSGLQREKTEPEMPVYLSTIEERGSKELD